MSFEREIIEGIRNKVPSKDYIKKNPDASKEPGRDALKVHVQSLKDTISAFDRYVKDTPQSKMGMRPISSYLRKIDDDIQAIRKEINISK